MEEKINYIIPEKISLSNHPILNEKWVQQKIAENPSIVGLGYHKNLILKDKERVQPKGRLDLLFQCSECSTRYEVEVQLGEVDESHIIRTIEYWDIERKRYPKYDHYAVLIAEDITSRFLNVISLLNRTIPLIVIKMEAYRYENNCWLIFTTVLDETDLFDLDEEDEIDEVTDRNYWEDKGASKTVAVVDGVLNLIKEFDGDYELKYNKSYIGLTKNGQADHFVRFIPRKQNVIMEIRLKQSEQINQSIEESGLVLMDYSNKCNKYKLRIFDEDIRNNKELILKLLKMSSGRIENN